jgi:cytochrome b pre-mRNA-processing protein 3
MRAQMFNRLISLFAKNRMDGPAVALYRQIVAQARQPVFYRDHAVPDTLDGRFDMIVLHAFLVMRRLKQIAGPEAQKVSQDLFDLLFADMDSNLREIGVGDLGVGKRVKKMAQAFYGRVEAYEAGLGAVDPAVLEQALARNLYGTLQAPGEVSAVALTALAAYLREADAVLMAQPDGTVVAGSLEFPKL